MFCEKCGKQLREGTKFCESCGARVEENEILVQQPTTAPNNTSSVGTDINSMNPVNPAATGGNKKLSKGFLAVIGAAVVVIILILIVVLTGKTRVNLNKYVTISCYGYDTVGQASFEFDYDSFIQDYQGKIKYKNGGKAEGFDLSSLNSFVSPAEILLESCVDGELDVITGLSNGDTIIFTWECDDELAKEMFGCKLKYSDIEYTVNELEKVDTFDPFEDIELVYTGVAPQGRVQVENNSSDSIVRDLYFSVTPYENLSNGDTITVNINDYYNADYFAETYGRVPSATEKEFVVDGLGTYVTSLSELSEEALGQFESQSDDIIRAEAARNWDEHVRIDAMACLGSYLLTAKSQDVYGANNEIYMVYKIRAAEDYPEQGIYQGMTYYYYISFNNLIVFPDNTCSVDLNNYSTCGKSFEHRTEYGDGWFDYINVRYKGYENLDTLFNDCVISRIDSYTYEDNVADVEL